LLALAVLLVVQADIHAMEILLLAVEQQAELLEFLAAQVAQLLMVPLTTGAFLVGLLALLVKATQGRVLVVVQPLTQMEFLAVLVEMVFQVVVVVFHKVLEQQQILAAQVGMV